MPARSRDKSKPFSLWEEFCRSFVLLRLLHRVARDSWFRTALFVPLFFAIPPLACFWASWKDKTLLLAQSNKGVGLLEHLGFGALFVSGPLIIFLVLMLLRRMASVIERFCADKPGDGGVAAGCRDRVVNMLTCRTVHFQLILATMMLFGSLALLANYQNTRQATAVFGHDVWDSSAHVIGFFIAKVVLAFEWIYLFPLLIYLGIATSFSILSIVNYIAAKPEIEILPFEPDHCGGYRPLGKAMLAVIYLNVPIALVVTGDILTHRNFYLTIVLAVILILAIVLFQVFFPFIKLHRLLVAGKAARLKELSALLTLQEVSVRARIKQVDDIREATLLTILATAELYRRAEAMRTWPYLPTDRFKWLAPLFPIALGILKKFIAP